MPFPSWMMPKKQEQNSNSTNNSNSNSNPNSGNSNQGEDSGEKLTGIDLFNKMLQNKPNEGDDSTKSKPPLDVKGLLADPENQQKLLQSLDVRAFISEETKQKMADNADDALVSLLQDVVGGTQLSTLQQVASMQELVLDDRMNSIRSTTKNDISQAQYEQRLFNALPLLQTPAVDLATKEFRDKLREQQPSISPEDMATQVKDYLTAVGSAMNPDEDKDQEDAKQEDGIDWLESLGLAEDFNRQS